MLYSQSKQRQLMNMRWEWLTFCFDFYLNGALCVSACVCCVICFYFDLLFFESMVLWLAWKFKIVLVFRQSIAEKERESARKTHREFESVYLCFALALFLWLCWKRVRFLIMWCLLLAVWVLLLSLKPTSYMQCIFLIIIL